MLRIVLEHCSRLCHNLVCLIEILIEQGEQQSLFKGDAVLFTSGKQNIYLLQPLWYLLYHHNRQELKRSSIVTSL